MEQGIRDPRSFLRVPKAAERKKGLRSNARGQVKALAAPKRKGSRNKVQAP